MGSFQGSLGVLLGHLSVKLEAGFKTQTHLWGSGVLKGIATSGGIIRSSNYMIGIWAEGYALNAFGVACPGLYTHPCQPHMQRVRLQACACKGTKAG